MSRGPRRYQPPPNQVPWPTVIRAGAGAILALLALYVVGSAVYTVAPHEKAVVLRFGRYHATVDPGLQFCIPVVDTVHKVSMEERSLRLPYGITQDRPHTTQSQEELTLMLTGDLNAASVEWTIQWQVVQPDQFLFRFYQADDPDYAEKLIVTVAQTVMDRLVGDYSIDEVLTEKRGEIAESARQATQELLDHYSCGISIRDLQMQRVSPPAKVRPAFDQVNASIQRRDQLENEANKERNRLVPAALAEKDKAIRTAQGYADRRRAEANGEIRALEARFEAYQKAPDLTRKRLYLESMQKIFEQVETKVILEESLGKQLLPLLPLEGARP